MTPNPIALRSGTGRGVLRVSTDAQTTDTRRQELETWAERAGHMVVKVDEDAGSAKGRDQRPDALIKAAGRGELNMFAVGCR